VEAILEEIEANQPQSYLTLTNVKKTFGKFVALEDVNLDVMPGEFICLLGPSGCGKTTLLRIIAGLEEQDTGQVFQGGKDVSRMPASKRDFGIVFQSYALFPNLTVAQNIAYGLQNTKAKKAEIRQKVQLLLEMVGLAGTGRKYPTQMSGGQQQRVALARAIALSPGLLLLDEPLSALDAKVRGHLRLEITQLQKRLGITTVMVTHDQLEALTMADRIVVMNAGRIEQIGTPKEIYQNPVSPFVAHFIGSMNFLPGRIDSEQGLLYLNPETSIRFDRQKLAFSGLMANLAIRPENIRLLNGNASEYANQQNVLTTKLEALEYLGSSYRLNLTVPKDSENHHHNLIVDLAADSFHHLPARNSSVQIHLPEQSIHLFPLEAESLN
jgi:iron(III) transport system ATP-binding protein